jgi:HPt (histidine-containing phosphotransfer) domain-containing protein
MLQKMCRSLESRVPEYLVAIRDAVRAQDALRLQQAAHKFCGMLSAFSTVAGDQAADLEDLAAHGLLQEALPVVEQFDEWATELARLVGGITVESLRKQAEHADGSRPNSQTPETIGGKHSTSPFQFTAVLGPKSVAQAEGVRLTSSRT